MKYVKSKNQGKLNLYKAHNFILKNKKKTCFFIVKKVQCDTPISIEIIGNF